MAGASPPGMIIGIDPGTVRCGISCFDLWAPTISSHVVEVSSGAPLTYRINAIAEEITSIIGQEILDSGIQPSGIVRVAWEGRTYKTSERGGETASKLRTAVETKILDRIHHSVRPIPFLEFSPTTLKAFAHGGRADKERMIEVLNEEIPYLKEYRPDAADAAWLALLGAATYGVWGVKDLKRRRDLVARYLSTGKTAPARRRMLRFKRPELLEVKSTPRRSAWVELKMRTEDSIHGTFPEW